jgi:hypothetical protein
MKTKTNIELSGIDRLSLLRVPFLPNQISKLPKPYKSDSPKGPCKECGGYHGLPAMHLDYVGHAALTDRLLDVDPQWAWEPVAFDANGLPAIDKDGGLWIKLTICAVTRLGYGDAQGKTGGNATKERIGDALRNAAMRFGAALDLWHKGDLHAEEEKNFDSEITKKNFDSEITKLQSCGSISALSIAWSKMDKQIQYALAAIKDECKNRILTAEKAAKEQEAA